MATFSTNQVRHLYVANELKTSALKAEDAAGSIFVKADNAKKHLYFNIKSVDGITRSDLIDITSINYAKATDADKMAHKMKSYKVVLDPSVNSGNPVVGQDYLLRIAFRQFVGMSDEDQYFKYGVAHAYSGMTASDLYKKLALSLVKNFSREVTPLLKFALTTATDPVTLDTTTKEDTLSGTYTGIVITELPQPWVRGKMPQTFVHFTVMPSFIYLDKDEVNWGVVTTEDSQTVIDNGKDIADLEYFCMGERGDIYRGMGYPNDIHTEYLVDSSKKYNLIDIHYSYTGANEGAQKSEKDITIAVPKVGETNSVSNKLTNDIITAINTASGLTIPTLEV